MVCRNCTLYKEAELPVIGRSKVRVCMSCILSHANGGENVQSPPRAVVVNSGEEDGGNENWVSHHMHSPTNTSDKDSEMAEMNRMSMMPKQFDYALDFSWEHPWPKPPLISRESERLEALNSFDVLDTPMEDVFDIICDLASNALKCPIAAVSLIDEERQWFKASVGLAQNEIPRNVSFCAHTITSKEPLVVMDTLGDKRFEKNPLVTGTAGIRFYAGAPICTSGGQILGTVFVFDTKPRDKCDIATLEKLSNVAMKNLEDRKNEVSAPVSRNAPSKPVSNEQQLVKQPAPKKENATKEQEQQQLVAQKGADGAIVGGPNMETMLMDLLCRTTETQQQLATQQGTMFQTLGNHTSQIDKLTDAVARMEAKLEARKADK